MNVRCPYCDCAYNIDVNSLPKPIGDLKLGYGWWLRCYRCHKKWWLKNSALHTANSPLTADRLSKIDKISKLKKPELTTTKKKSYAAIKYILLTLFIFAAAFGFYNRDLFKNYIVEKIQHLSTSMLMKLKMSDVQYVLQKSKVNENNVTLITIGKVLNEEKKVVKVRGVKVVVYNEQNIEIASWTDKLKVEYIVAGETIDFYSEHEISPPTGSIKVDVSIF